MLPSLVLLSTSTHHDGQNKRPRDEDEDEKDSIAQGTEDAQNEWLRIISGDNKRGKLVFELIDFVPDTQVRLYVTFADIHRGNRWVNVRLQIKEERGGNKLDATAPFEQSAMKAYGTVDRAIEGLFQGLDEGYTVLAVKSWEQHGSADQATEKTLYPLSSSKSARASGYP